MCTVNFNSIYSCQLALLVKCSLAIKRVGNIRYNIGLVTFYSFYGSLALKIDSLTVTVHKVN